jgi:hypothetical protein
LENRQEVVLQGLKVNSAYLAVEQLIVPEKKSVESRSR